MRQAEVKRTTQETCIQLDLNIDGSGEYDNMTGSGFLDHMLDVMTKQSRFDLNVHCSGDLHVDSHHTTEDIGIVLGQAMAKAMGDMRGIQRYGCATLPMDDALVMVAIDFSGRSYLNYDVHTPAQKLGEFDTEAVKEFFWALCRHAGITVHIRQLYGENSHHILECVFKAFGRALRQACSMDPEFPNDIPSTKGMLV